MKKLTVAAFIIGTFIIFSLTHQPSNSSAFLAPTVTTSSVANIVTPTVAASGPPATATTNAVVADVTSQPKPTPTTQDPTSAPAPTPTVAPTQTTSATVKYKDGSYTGHIESAQWGYVIVQADISQGKITNVKFVRYPNDRSRSVRINAYADPVLIKEAIQAQSAQVDVVTGATDSSEAFMKSLSDALTQARG